MVKTYWVECASGYVVVAYSILVTAQVPLEVIRVLNWVGLGLGWA